MNILSKRVDNDGRIILLNMEINDEPYTLINLYAPNTEKERKQLFKKVDKWLNVYAEMKEKCIISGDFNYTPNPGLDRKLHPENRQNVDSSKLLYDKLVNSYSLTDIWRLKHKNIKQYTCRSQSRIDLILCSDSIVPMVKEIQIRKPYVFSDHNNVYMSLDISVQPQGPGYWKLNCSMLKDQNYVTGVKNIINKIKEQYKPDDAKQVIWEMCKLEIKEYSMKYGKLAKQNESEEIKQLQVELAKVQDQLVKNDCEPLRDRQSELLDRLESYYVKKAKAAQIRARVQDIEEGEKNTKYFLGLEKSRQINNCIRSVKVNDRRISNGNEIIKEVVEYWSEMYRSKNVDDREINEYLETVTLEQSLNVHEQQKCEGFLDVDECKQVLIGMKKNKSPGSDGLPPEFYLAFWDEVKYMLVDCLNESFMTGRMSASQRKSIITLIFKKGDREQLKNWRPISVLNTDYKLMAFVIAQRLHKVLPKIVNSDQTGYIKGRFIGSNIRLIEDIFEYVNKNNMPGAAIFCDFEKAFDSVEFNFVSKVLEKFNFGPQLRQWINVFYSDIYSSVKCNNWITKSFKVTRGIRQGCPVSALIFVLVAEIMAVKIRKNNDIKGILLPGGEVKLSQLADDTTLFMSDETSILNVLEEIKKFGSVAGLRLNLLKTKGMRLGSMRKNQKEIGDIVWTSDPVKTLGVYFGHDSKEKGMLNWEAKISEVERCINIWKPRNLTIVGRITVVKTFVLSKVAYLAASVECPSAYVKRINQIIYNFIWKGKRDKVKRQTMIMKREEGGLGVIDFKLQERSMKVMMLKRILTKGKENWKRLPLYYLSKPGQNNLLLHLDSIPESHIMESFTMPGYYEQIVKAWYCCKQKKQTDVNTRLIREQIIWSNNNIRYKGKTLWFSNWIESNILFVNDIFNNEGTFKDEVFNSIKDRRNVIAELHMLKNAIPVTWKQKLLSDPCNMQIRKAVKPALLINGHCIDVDKITSSKQIYTWLVNINKKKPCTQVYWREVFQDKNIIWSNVYIEKMKYVLEQKIVAFNFKILNNIIATPHKLWRWKLNRNEICHLCFSEGTLEHMMINCCYFEDYYKCLKNIFESIGYGNIKMNLYTLVCGYKPNIAEYRIVNILLNLIFFNVYKCWIRMRLEKCRINPIYALCNELKIRCKTTIYSDIMFSQIKDKIQMYHVN